ncbi:MAG: M23 family metallopeptidase [bacterium]
MLRLSTKSATLLTAMAIAVTATSLPAADWPMRQSIDLSSGFGDFRPNHFHFGVDIRTGGTIGRSLYSPVDGHVYRVRTSFFGYGKVLYIKGDDDLVYVFGHLANFAPDIDLPLKSAQVDSQRYYQDLNFTEDSIRIGKGDFIAYTGQSGAGGPHVQFEVRTEENVPVNPLRHGFDLQDKMRPVFSRIGFQLVDDSSLFDVGARKMFWDVVPTGKPGHYRLDTTLYFHRPMGILVDCFDQMRDGGMQQSVYRLSLYVDDRLLYEVVFDSLDFDQKAAVKLEYDYEEVIAGRKNVRALFKKAGNVYGGSRGEGGADGIYGLNNDQRLGLKKGRIVAEDCFGNSAQLSFEFLWGPPGNIFTLDSTLKVTTDTTLFYFTPVVDLKELRVDSVKVMLNRQERWGVPPSMQLAFLDDGVLRCRAYGYKVGSAVMRLFLYAHQGCLIRDNLFNGLLPKGTAKFSVEHQVLEDGLLVAINASATNSSWTRLELYRSDTLLGIEYPQYFNMKRYLCFIPPRPEYARIDRIAVALSRDTVYPVLHSDSVHIVAVGFDQEEIIAAGDLFSLRMGRDNFYRPRYLELKRTPLHNRSLQRLNSPFYEIVPEAFVCREDFEILLEIPSTNQFNRVSGLCWLDQEEDRWVWLEDNKFEDGLLSATSTGGGIFAAVFDYDPPRLKFLTLADGRTYQSNQPAVNFIIEDTLSGIGDDRDIVIKIDGKWLIPEYDPETGQCRSKPLEPLPPGKHHLGIRVTDRAGNMAEKYLNFRVKE